jgi:hypothetical protein
MNKDDLILALQTSFNNRKKELTDFFLFIKEQENLPISDTVNKAYVLLLYAHWEGFIKESSLKYFNFICTQKRPVKKLTENFYLIYFKNLLKNYSISRNINIEKDLLEKTLNQNRKFKIPLDEKHFLKFILGIEDNLKTDNYKNICSILNYTLNDSTGKFNRLLQKLVHNRNAIAHTGIKAEDDTYSDLTDIEDMKNIILDEMNNFYSFLESNIKDKLYLKSNT